MVLTDDDSSTLVEVFVEGRSFWRKIRSALGLLLGASVLGFAAPLTSHHILAVNAWNCRSPSG